MYLFQGLQGNESLVHAGAAMQLNPSQPKWRGSILWTGHGRRKHHGSYVHTVYSLMCNLGFDLT